MEFIEPDFIQDSPPEILTGQEEPILHAENLSLGFGSNPVLRDIDFSVFKGETVAIIGESGCGKTVLLKTLIGLNKPNTGRIFFDGNDLNRLSYFDLARIRTRYGFVFQQAALFDSMTVRENIAFSLVQHTNKSKKEINETVERLVHEVGLLQQVLDKKPAELSGGMRKRVGFARALALEPELMLYDEPTTGLDPIMSDVINELMIETQTRHNVTSIMVTHDMKSACKVAGRILMLYPIAKLAESEPQIIFDGTTEELNMSTDQRVLQFLGIKNQDTRSE
ncbi:MAG: ATP-binding cassette domain-containing protein [Planctomycetaceae bacterium]|jgi:phospholipid/cholesterol/gamma-HCH transport system ATP-binding protein|nr:ATP-binding cassette domain-containing protein [Planctomycetaceae bacterium]